MTVAEDTRFDGSVAVSGSAEVVECELRRPAVEDRQSRLRKWRDSGQGQANQRKRAMRRAVPSTGSQGGIADRGRRQTASCCLQGRGRAQCCGAALLCVERCDSGLVDWKVTTCG